MYDELKNKRASPTEEALKNRGFAAIT